VPPADQDTSEDEPGRRTAWLDKSVLVAAAPAVARLRIAAEGITDYLN